MNLPSFCIKRPAFTIVISLVIVIVGLIGFMNLSLRWIPNVTPPQVSIGTQYPGADAKLIENQITIPIESALAGVNGIDSLTSNTRRGESFIDVQFKLGYPLDTAIEDIRSSIDHIRDQLPKDAKQP